MSVEIRDRRFDEVVGASLTFERLADGFLFLEGPLWDAAHRRLLFTDIPADTIYQWSAAGGVADFSRARAARATASRSTSTGDFCAASMRRAA